MPLSLHLSSSDARKKQENSLKQQQGWMNIACLPWFLSIERKNINMEIQ